MSGNDLVRVGWLMFAMSGVLFIIAGWRERDPYTVAGSIVWLIGVVLFLSATRRT